MARKTYNSAAWNAAQARALAGKPPKWMVDEPEFDDVLRSAGGDVKSAAVRSWVQQHQHHRFVPLAVLDAMGINHDWVFQERKA